MIRTQTLTKYNIKVYRSIGICTHTLLLLGFLTILVLSILSTGLKPGSYVHILSATFLFIPFVRSIKLILSVKPIEFSQEGIFIPSGDFEIHLPLETVKSIKLVALSGIYRMELYQNEQLGKEIFFKPSLFYPLNFNSIDDKVDQLRQLINKRKRDIMEGKAMPGQRINIDDRGEPIAQKTYELSS